VEALRLLISVFGRKAMGLTRDRVGTELFVQTRAGRIRTLAYRMDDAETMPLFVNIHGGGFTIGCPEMDDRFMADIAREAGVKILSIDYSLAPEAPFPMALEQCYAVVLYAAQHAAELGVDSGRIAIGGHSAGGNLSAGVCLLDAERRELGLKALILDYPPLDLLNDPYAKPRPKKAIPPRTARMFDLAYVGSRELAGNPLVSPCYATDEQVSSFPPTLVITAGEDSLAPEAEAFKDRLIEAGVDVTFRRFEGASHGFTHTGEPPAEEAWRLMIDHLVRHLGRARLPV